MNNIVNYETINNEPKTYLIIILLELVEIKGFKLGAKYQK